MARWTTLEEWKRVDKPPPGATSMQKHAMGPLIDPYATWAVLSDWRGYQRMGAFPTLKQPAQVRILARAESPAALHRALSDTATLDIPKVYRQSVDRSKPEQPASHFTATLARSDLDKLHAKHPGLVWELAVPRRPPSTPERVDTIGDEVPRRHPEAMRAPPVVAKPSPGESRKFEAFERTMAVASSAVATMGVIDYGLPFLDPRYATPDGRASRVLALWDQDERPYEASNGAWWIRPASPMGYGRVLTRPAIEMLRDRILRPLSNVPCDEAALYRSIDYLVGYGDARRRALFATHGAVVADLACGCPDPLARFRASGVEDIPDAAASADLLFVQLPGLTAGDSTGSSLGAHLLDAVRWIMSQAGDLEDESPRPLVISISYGSYAGAHDGTSLIESALDELLDFRKDNFAIVLAAGNSRREQCHVRRSTRKAGLGFRHPLLRLELAPQDSTDSFVEIWSRKPGKRHPGSLEARVRDPSGAWSGWVSRANPVLVLTDPATDRLLGMLQFVQSPPGSKTKSLLLLSLAPTLPTSDDDGPVVPHGIWELEIQADSDAQDAITFDAWIERDDPGDVRFRSQARFLTVDPNDQLNTLSSIATGRSTLLAGAYRLSSGRPTEYSSLPDLRSRVLKDRRMVLVAAEEDALTPTLRAGGVRSEDVFRMNGTSVAAPILARQLLNVMHLGPVKRDDWPDVLRALARHSNESLVRVPGDLGF